MDLRILRYFLTVAKEQSFTKAAEQLHITQPTLSRQLAAFEEELGISLFNRNGRTITLTDEGILLKRRALEMLDLEKRTLEELKGTEEVIDGSVTIGCGEFAAVEILAEICKVCRKISARTDRDPHRHGGYGLRDDEKRSRGHRNVPGTCGYGRSRLHPDLGK